MKLVPTRRADYAIRAMVFLAGHPDQFVKADVIATGMDIPRTFIPQVLQALQQAGLVVSRPSHYGGYALARPASAISVFDVVEALEGPLEDSECALRGGPCHWEDVCALHWVWSSARQAFVQRLQAAALAEVAADDAALAAGARPVPPDSHRTRRRASGKAPTAEASRRS